MCCSKRGCDDLYDLFSGLFMAGAVTCALFAFHRIATALKIQARVEVLEEMGDAFTAEEREELVHKIKQRALHL